jgi:histidinol-phosphatase (PHP family)
MDTDYVYGLYFEQFEKMLDYNYFDVVCHLDLVKKFGRKSSRSFDNELNKILSKIKAGNLTVEINTSGYNYPVREIFPAPNIITKCQEQGINITLGSDAHKPTDVGQHYDRVLPLLLSAGYRHLTTFTKRKRSSVSLKPKTNQNRPTG